jgi:hypothetical protein
MHRLGWIVCCGALGLAACRTPVVPDPEPLPSDYDVWTTPPPGAETPRIERRPTAAAQSPWTLDAEVSALNRYAWRGQSITDDPVVQPAASVGYESVSLGVWANLDLTDVNGNAGQFSEVDVTFEWAQAVRLGCVEGEVVAGAVAYFFPNTTLPTTVEVYAGLGLDVPLDPRLTVYRDVDEIDGTYATFDMGHAVELGDVSIAGTAGIGWGSRGYNDGYFGVRADTWNDFHARLGAAWTRGRFTVEPFVGWQSMVADRIRAATGPSDLFVVGLTLGASW